MSRGRMSVVVSLLAVTLSPLAAAADFTLFTSPGLLEAIDVEGNIVWTYATASDRIPAVVDHFENRILLADGTLLDAQGTVLARTEHVELPAGFGDADRAAAWDQPFELYPVGNDTHHPPLFDRGGNAWIFDTHIESGDYTLLLRRAQRQSGSWDPIETVVDSANYVAAPDMGMDSSDNVVVAFRDISGGQQRLYVTRYTQAGGWTTPAQLYASSSLFTAIEVAADERGNFVVAFDAVVGGRNSASIAVYDVNAGTWGPITQVSPDNASVDMPTLVRNRAGDALYLVYVASSIDDERIYAHRWDAGTRSFGPIEPVPGSEIASFSGIGATSKPPAVVDDAGNLTIMWDDGDNIPYASRRETGTWGPAIQLQGTDIVDTQNFAGATVNAAGEVFLVASEFGGGVVLLRTFKYEPGTGWLPGETVHSAAVIVGTRTRISFYQNGRAVATMLGRPGTELELISVLYDGFAWRPEVIDIPQQERAYYSDLGANRGAVLLIYEGEDGSGNVGIRATWLRDPHLADLNCDGVVSAADIDPFVIALTGGESVYAANQPDCYYLSADCNGDGEVSAADIDPFVQLLTRAAAR
jgi:hypothetical protein